MGAIIDFIKGIANFVVSLVQFVIDFIGDIVYMISLTAQFAVNIPTYFAWLPDVIVSIIVTIFSIVVIYKILGREG